MTLSLFFDNLVGDPEKRSFCGEWFFGTLVLKAVICELVVSQSCSWLVEPASVGDADH